jgi:hypothetical protein
MYNFKPQERIPLRTHDVEGWVCHRTAMDSVGKKKCLAQQESNSNLPSILPEASHYTTGIYKIE